MSFFSGSIETGRLIATILLELSFDTSIRENLASQELAGKFNDISLHSISVWLMNFSHWTHFFAIQQQTNL